MRTSAATIPNPIRGDIRGRLEGIHVLSKAYNRRKEGRFVDNAEALGFESAVDDLCLG
jgi:hypothetical protein